MRRAWSRAVLGGMLAIVTVAPLHEVRAGARPNCRPPAGTPVDAPAAVTRACRPAPAPPAAPAPVLSKAQIAEREILVRVNAERAARGIGPLQLDTFLSSQARGWSYTMSVTGFRHSDLSRLFNGRFNYVGENIAWASGSGATAGKLHLMWMQSSGHRENMLAPAYNTIGIGVHCAPDGTIWATQNFGRTNALGQAPPFSVPPQNPIVRPDAGTAGC